MLRAFQQHIASQKLFEPQDKLLVAISGGIDSVVMAHLLKKSGFNFSLAHCNFGLRKKDSDYDEDFCRQLSKTLEVDFYNTRFDVKAYQKKNKVSVQMAARELRYQWFSELLEKKKLDYLLTAHHGNDVIETTFINLLRGTGINGLKGIPEKSAQIVRPMLSFTKEEILAYATENKISFRLDKSNFEDKYERNFLRLNILPAFKKLHPNVERTILNNVANFKEEAGIVNDYILEALERIAVTAGGMLYLDKKLLLKEKYLKTLIHYSLAPMGFNATQISDLEKNISSNGLTGKTLQSATHTLTIDRTQLVVKKNGPAPVNQVQISSFAQLQKSPLFKVKKTAGFSVPGKNELYVEAAKLVFPLVIRAKITGDRFKPFGMKGFKLLSDFLKEQKLNKFEKESCKLLVNGNGDIIWVVGYRSDERYKVNLKSKDLIKFTLVE
ncbi:MAG: tRNA lysidine(34) synthetase TilS [Bacteroidota bacterium]